MNNDSLVERLKAAGVGHEGAIGEAYRQGISDNANRVLKVMIEWRRDDAIRNSAPSPTEPYEVEVWMRALKIILPGVADSE